MSAAAREFFFFNQTALQGITNLTQVNGMFQVSAHLSNQITVLSNSAHAINNAGTCDYTSIHHNMADNWIHRDIQIPHHVPPSPQHYFQLPVHPAHSANATQRSPPFPLRISTKAESPKGSLHSASEFEFAWKS